MLLGIIFFHKLVAMAKCILFFQWQKFGFLPHDQRITWRTNLGLFETGHKRSAISASTTTLETASSSSSDQLQNLSRYRCLPRPSPRSNGYPSSTVRKLVSIAIWNLSKMKRRSGKKTCKYDISNNKKEGKWLNIWTFKWLATHMCNINNNSLFLRTQNFKCKTLQ